MKESLRELENLKPPLSRSEILNLRRRLKEQIAALERQQHEQGRSMMGSRSDRMWLGYVGDLQNRQLYDLEAKTSHLLI
jgi:hypothetical protein